MEEVSKLKLEWKRREGGGGRTQRDFLDVVIDGRPLSELVGDYVSCLGWLSPEENAKAAKYSELPPDSCVVTPNRHSALECRHA